MKTEAYKGFLIRVDYLGRCTISKGEHHISFAKNMDDAKALIHELEFNGKNVVQTYNENQLVERNEV